MPVSQYHQRNRRMRLTASCARGFVHRRVPVTAWLPSYKREDILPDLIAGVTVGLTLIPQSIAYAALAGLAPQHGLYSAFLGSFVYIVLGTVKEVNLGPKALLSLLTFNYTHALGPQYAILLCFLCGCFELLCGVLQLGFLVEFVSAPVVSGFTSAAAITIASAQVKALLGLKFHSESIVQTLQGVVKHVQHTRPWDAGLGASCFVVLLALKSLKERVKLGEEQKLLRGLVWFTSTARNAIVVLVCSCVASALSPDAPFFLTGRVEAGLPTVQLPPFSAQVGNDTVTFVEMSASLGSGVVVTSLVAILSNLAIGKAFASGKMLDATQEMMTLGICNIAGSMVGSMPVAGAFSRSALSSASGVRTPLAGLYTGVMVILSLNLLTPYFYFIPRATLAAVIMCAVLSLVDVDILPKLWRTSKQDLAACVCAFTACLLLGMEVGIISGVAIDVAFLLYTNARPCVAADVVTSEQRHEYLLATPTLGLLFPAADHLRSAVLRSCERPDVQAGLPVVLDCRNVFKIDFTAATGLESLSRDLRSRGHELVLLHVRDCVLRVLTSACTRDVHLATSQDELDAMLKDGKNSDKWRKISRNVEERPLIRLQSRRTEIES